MIETEIHNVKSIRIDKTIDWDGLALGTRAYQTKDIVIKTEDGSEYRISTFSAGEKIEIIQGGTNEN